MELQQTVTPCPKCGTRITVSERRDPSSDRVTSHEVICPVCWTGVTFVIRNGAGKAALICYERPSRPESRRMN